jgi:hypothetical protein
VTAGTPLDVSKSPGSYTGKYLKKLIKKWPLIFLKLSFLQILVFI